ncbi:MAG TPA: hypothetical protein VFL83_16080 [Anaeromyxobacter sp.]|nr:hypothetical protein [Anaeromyxobacter sp.]
MSKGLAAGRVVRSLREQEDRCLALSGKGAPGPGDLERAVAALKLAAEALRDRRLRGAHALDVPEPEVRLRAPSPGARGGTGWTVFVRVPPWVGTRAARAAALEASDHAPVAKSIRLSPVVTEPARRRSPPGRDRQPGQIRRRQTGPQHRARELR